MANNTNIQVCLFVYSKRHLDQKDDEDVEVEEDNDQEIDEDVNIALSHFVKKGKGMSSKRPGHKPRWCSKILDDFVDIVDSSNEFKTKLIFTNTKNQRNGPIYAKIMDELKERASARGEKITMTINQMRTKFKKCVSQCKQAALTQKTATGIKRYQEDCGFRKWFNALFDVVKTANQNVLWSHQDLHHHLHAPHGSSFDDSTADNVEDQAELFVPKRSVKKGKSNKDKLDTTQEVMQLIQ